MLLLSIVNGIALHGLDGFLVNVEVDISAGMPCWEVVGLPDANIKEAKERVRTAIKNCGIEFLSRRYIINLSPANIRKNGAFLDLAIAVAILKSMQIINNENLKNIVFIGELSLDGRINKVNGILPMCIEALKNNINELILPKENAKEAAIVKGMKVIGVSNLKEVIDYLNKRINIIPEEVKLDELLKKQESSELDFSEVKGHKMAKRALEIAAAGGHNCLLIGSPGSGKTMMSKRITTILPDLTFEETLEITKIHSIVGMLNNQSLITKRPFRSPHHNITEPALIGGGRIPMPGEVSLAHLGVLFLDELLEFNKNILEVLRIPLEEKKINISRINGNISYPCNCMLIGSMNPCPCGYYGSKEKECICTEAQRNNYKSKLSGPMLDRFDIHIMVPSVNYKEMNTQNNESSESIRNRVNKARKLQQKRYSNYHIYSNAELTPKLIEKYCILEKNAQIKLEEMLEKMKLSSRAYSKILKVSRTIADLDDTQKIEEKHVLEAIQYRNLDKL